MIKYLGTHNSGTSYKLVWWQRPFSGILNLFAKCQNLTIGEQLNNNVRLFNLQITWYRNRWVFSHGLCIYNKNVMETINKMMRYASKDSPIYIQIYLDRNFILKQNKIEFRYFIKDLKKYLENSHVYLISDWIEGTSEKHTYKTDISITEHYWTQSWAKDKSWFEKLPLLKRHAKKYNYNYIKENNSDYLMLDFVDIKF